MHQEKEIDTQQYSTVKLTLHDTGPRHAALCYELTAEPIQVIKRGTKSSLQKAFDKMSSGRLSNMIKAKEEARSE